MLFFLADDWLYALNPATGEPIANFGRGGHVPARSVVATDIYKHIIRIPCWKVLRAFDITTEAPLWTFNSIPGPGEFGHDTWPVPGYGAGSWGGMALDEARGIAYISTGSSHPNYLGMHYPGRNLFANCVIALNADR